ncbi:hypothetical protein BC629DRAFT_864049 [Irpex lacteus]|nr:hypothetical protein BC629DRAFT_864049 [Irpex lacteus]
MLTAGWARIPTRGCLVVLAILAGDNVHTRDTVIATVEKLNGCCCCVAVVDNVCALRLVVFSYRCGHRSAGAAFCFRSFANDMPSSDHVVDLSSSSVGSDLVPYLRGPARRCGRRRVQGGRCI